MKFVLDQKNAIFIERENRFVGLVELLEEGKKIECKVHIPNTGRCKELLYPGNQVIIEDREKPSRKYKYELILVRKNDNWISIDSQLPNKLALDGILSGKIIELQGYTTIKREHTDGNSRFDLLLTKETTKKGSSDKKEVNTDKTGVDAEKTGVNTEKCFIEVKGVTLEKDGLAMFPDAPTERGRKHLEELTRLKLEGHRAVVLFVVQMESVDRFRPYFENDLEFARKLRYASFAGVEILVYKCSVSENGVEILESIPFFFEGFD